jgi:hypothetical protein
MHPVPGLRRLQLLPGLCGPESVQKSERTPPWRLLTAGPR